MGMHRARVRFREGSRRSLVNLVIVVAAIAMTFAALGVPAAGAVQLPKQLVDKLERDHQDARTRLTHERAELGPVAQAQREATAAEERLRERATVLEDVAALVGAHLPTPLAESLDDELAPATAARKRSQAALDAATTATADAQAAVLDSERRLRAIKRAASTESKRDATLGSWRFGSGGPPVSAESLDRYLESKGSPLAGSGAAFLESGLKHKLDPRLLVAIAGAESYFGVTTCAPHNAWGWGCPTSPFRFDSWAHAIDTVAAGLAENYVADGLTTVGKIHLRYAPPNATNDPNDLNYGWAQNVAQFLMELGGDPQDIAGVLGPSR